MTDPYEALGVSPSATQPEIVHAYRRQLRDYHPDIRSKAPNAGADERLRQILAAYALLRDPARRAAYDRAHLEAEKIRPVPITITRRIDREDRPPLWVGPVRWHH